MKIYAPVKDANGVWASVRFVNGVGETDNPRLIEWFKSHGYKVPIEDVECEETPVNSVEQCVEIVEPEEEVEMMGYNERSVREPNFDDMTPNELRDWAKANGLGGVIKNTRSKEKLLELIRG